MGTIIVNINSGTPPYVVTFFPSITGSPFIFTSTGNKEFDNVPGGLYNISCEDSHGCIQNLHDIFVPGGTTTTTTTNNISSTTTTTTTLPYNDICLTIEGIYIDDFADLPLLPSGYEHPCQDTLSGGVGHHHCNNALFEVYANGTMYLGEFRINDEYGLLSGDISSHGTYIYGDYSNTPTPLLNPWTGAPQSRYSKVTLSTAQAAILATDIVNISLVGLSTQPFPHTNTTWVRITDSGNNILANTCLDAANSLDIASCFIAPTTTTSTSTTTTTSTTSLLVANWFIFGTTYADFEIKVNDVLVLQRSGVVQSGSFTFIPGSKIEVIMVNGGGPGITVDMTGGYYDGCGSMGCGPIGFINNHVNTNVTINAYSTVVTTTTTTTHTTTSTTTSTSTSTSTTTTTSTTHAPTTTTTSTTSTSTTHIPTTTTTTTPIPSFGYNITLNLCSDCSLSSTGSIFNVEPLVVGKWYYNPTFGKRMYISSIHPGTFPIDNYVSILTQQDTCSAVVCPGSTTTTTTTTILSPVAKIMVIILSNTNEGDNTQEMSVYSQRTSAGHFMNIISLLNTTTPYHNVVYRSIFNNAYFPLNGELYNTTMDFNSTYPVGIKQFDTALGHTFRYFVSSVDYTVPDSTNPIPNLATIIADSSIYPTLNKVVGAIFSGDYRWEGSFTYTQIPSVTNYIYIIIDYREAPPTTTSTTTTTTTSMIPIVPLTVFLTSFNYINCNSFQANGLVTNDGGSFVALRGVCYGTSSMPTFSSTHTYDGAGIGAFISDGLSLPSGTTYYVRAYATNGLTTAYSDQQIITTVTPATIDIINNSSVATVSDVTINGISIIGATYLVHPSETTSGTSCELGSSSLGITVSSRSSSQYIQVSDSLGYIQDVDFSGGTTLVVIDNVNVSSIADVIITIEDGSSSGLYLPTVLTLPPKIVDSNTVTLGGNITSDGGSGIIHKGVVYTVTQNPTLADMSGNESFDPGNYYIITPGYNFPVQITYYVRAYATNSVGTAYGRQEQFTIQYYGGGCPIVSPVPIDLHAHIGYLHIQNMQGNTSIKIITEQGVTIQVWAVNPYQDTNLMISPVIYASGWYILNFYSPVHYTCQRVIEILGGAAEQQ